MRSSNPSREPLEVLKTYPAFQVLRAKALTHQWQFRPKQSKRLQRQGKLDQTLDERTQSCWNALADAVLAGYYQNEAEELALPIILVSARGDK